MSNFLNTLHAAECEAHAILKAVPEYKAAYLEYEGDELLSAMIEISNKYGLKTL